MNITRYIATALLGFSAVSQSVKAGDNLQSLFDLDISDLANVELTVASFEPEHLINTPAVVSSYKIDDFAHLGLRTLKDVLSFIPGFTIQDASLGGATVMIRGVTETFNQKVLFLVDGVPYWMPSHSGIPLLGIPISSIDSVEVIRGPGAVIYGTNASTGVIKIVTKKSARNELALTVGEDGRTNGNIYYHHSFDRFGSINVSLETQNDDGYDGQHFNAPLPPGSWSAMTVPPRDGSIKKPEDFSSVLINYQLDDLALGFQKYSASVNGLAGFGSLANQSSLDESGFLLSMSDRWRWGASTVSMYSDYNEHFLEIPVDNHPIEGQDVRFAFDNNGKDNNRWRVGGNINQAINNKLSLLLGLETERRSTGNYEVIRNSNDAVLATLIPEDATRENSAFAQFDWRSGLWRFLVGARYIDNEKSGSNISPRLAAVREIDAKRSIKFLYSEGFNSPNFAQQLIFIPKAITGHEDLSAELIKSTDIAYSSVDNNSVFVANIYYFSAQDFITRLRVENDGHHFVNSDEFSRYGIELEYQYARDSWKAFGNMSWHRQGGQVLSEDVTAFFAPKINANLGGLYQLGDAHLVGGNIRTIGSRGEAGSKTQVDLNYEYHFVKQMITLTMKNALDEDILHPDIQNHNSDYLVPGGGGRRFELGYHYRF